MSIQKLHWNGHSSFLTVAQTWKQPRWPSTGKWINTQRCIRTMEYYSAIKEWIGHEKTWKNLKGGLLSERSHLKSLHTAQSQHNTLEKATPWRHREKVQWWPGFQVEARKDEQVEHFQGSETTLHDTMTDTCHYTCVQNHRMDTTKNDPDINHRL